METFYIAIIIGLVEGITEFLPVSSTGHMILVGHLLGFIGEKADTFEIFIQLGAILAVAFLYKEKFFALFNFTAQKNPEEFAGKKGILLLALTTLPALVIGKFAHHAIKEHLFSPLTVAIGLGVGGLAIVIIEKFLPQPHKLGLKAITRKDALLVGFFQCLALWPGMSRSASTMMGGMLLGIERKTIAEYSFLAAVPLMIAATGYDLLKSRHLLHTSDFGFFAIGFVVSFIAAWAAIKIFIRFIGNHTLSGFGWYRIALAAFSFWFFTR